MFDRTNVTMWVSYDEGSTWPVKRSIAAGQSAYSQLRFCPMERLVFTPKKMGQYLIKCISLIIRSNG